LKYFKLSKLRFVLIGACGLFAVIAVAEEEFPETISLEYALQRAESNHPDIQQAQAALALAESEQLDAEVLTGTNVSIQARLRYIEPYNTNFDNTRNDNGISFKVNKNLYDFGRSQSASRAANLAISSERITLASTRNQRRLDIMRRYFDVMLADMAFLRDDEDMATAYVTLDKARDRRDVGQLSDVDVLNLENKYQQVRIRRYRSDNQQRSTRSALAIAMNQSGQLPATLEDPKLPSLSRKLPEFEEIQKIVNKNNPALRAARERLAASQSRLEAARADSSPVLSGELAFNEDNRAIGSREQARIGLVLNLPLSTGGRTRALIARQQAELTGVRADLARQKILLEQQVLDVWLEISNLKAQHQQAIAQLDYRELYLDQRRALYELETQTDLGDAMVQISEAQRFLKQTEFDIAYRWAQLDALMGNVIYATASEQGELK